MNTLKRLAVTAFACLTGVGVIAQTTEQAQQDSDAALDTIAIINQINYAVEVVRSYHNVCALEDEYERISVDNLNLNSIRDEETLQLIRDMRETLNGMRMNDRARKWYRHVLTRDLKGAKLEGMAKMANAVTTSLVNGEGGLWSRLGQAVSATISAGVETVADYKKAEHAMQGQFEDKEFELDTEKLNRLHEMNDKLLVRQWNLIRSYRLDDRLRVTAKDVQALVRCVKGSNPKNVFRQLKPMERAFEVYPTYWYYRAAMAMAAGDMKDALSSCEHFERSNRRLFRTDQMAATVAMIKITAMLDLKPSDADLSPEDREVVEKALEVIGEQNYTLENADQGIFCASVYLSVLNDADMANDVLEALMARLAEESRDELTEYRDLFTRPAEAGKKDSPPNTVYLVQCRMLRIAIDQKREGKVHIDRLKEICGRETTCSLEKLFYFGELRISDLWEIAKGEVEKINLSADGSRVVAEIPVAWFLLGELDVAVEALKGTNVVKVLKGDDIRRSHVMSSPHLVPLAKSEAYVRIVMSVEEGALAGCDGVRLRLNHVSWPVDLLYASEKPIAKGSVYLVPVRVERFMGKGIDKVIWDDPAAQVKKNAMELRLAAEQGDAEAQYKLVDSYNSGEGVVQDKGESVKWLRKAAEQGYVEAQYKLADCYYDGEGVVQDREEAVKWYRKAAEQGHAAAQFSLGVCYRYGFGVSRDKKEAEKWLRKAAEQGDVAAKAMLIQLKFSLF